jgi:hypothetical protein
VIARAFVDLLRYHADLNNQLRAERIGLGVSH